MRKTTIFKFVNCIQILLSWCFLLSLKQKEVMLICWGLSFANFFCDICQYVQGNIWNTSSIIDILGVRKLDLIGIQLFKFAKSISFCSTLHNVFFVFIETLWLWIYVTFLWNKICIWALNDFSFLFFYFFNN